MNKLEVLTLIQKLVAAYPNFRITPPLAEMWVHELATVTTPDVQEAFRRYVVAHPPMYAPTLTQLLDLAETVRREGRAREVAAHRAAMDGMTLPKLLEDAASRSSDRNQVWAREHVAMFLAGVSKPGREQDAIAWCEQKAQAYPEDAADWWKEAAMYWRALDRTESTDVIPF